MYMCGYCGGAAVWSEYAIAYVHADHGARVSRNGSGDLVSGMHNYAGTVINRADLIDTEES
jgi:hypothetical protein